jgi:hypothetical protein
MLVGEGCAHIASSMSCVAESSPVMLRHSAMNLLAIRPGLSLLVFFILVSILISVNIYVVRYAAVLLIQNVNPDPNFSIPDPCSKRSQIRIKEFMYF